MYTYNNYMYHIAGNFRWCKFSYTHLNIEIIICTAQDSNVEPIAVEFV